MKTLKELIETDKKFNMAYNIGMLEIQIENLPKNSEARDSLIERKNTYLKMYQDLPILE